MPNEAPQQWVDAGLIRILSDMTVSVVAGDHDGVLVGAELILVQDWPGFGPDLVLGDLTEADYDGYARQAITAWTEEPYIGSDGAVSIQPAPACYTFRPVDPVVASNTIVAAGIIDSDGALLSIGGLEEVVEFASSLDALTLLVEVSLPVSPFLGLLLGEG